MKITAEPRSDQLNADRVCSYPGCGRKHNARGLCGPHGVMQRRGQTLRPIQDRTGPIARTTEERFVSHIEVAKSGCVEWTGSLTVGGYGSFAVDSRHSVTGKGLAHRWAYEKYVEPIPVGLDLDHLCRNRKCVNPDHLEPVTRQVNILRATALKTHCPAGHPYSEENTYVRPGTTHRKCRTCARNRDQAKRKAS